MRTQRALALTLLFSLGCTARAPDPAGSDDAAARAPASVTLSRGRYLMGTEVEMSIGGLPREGLVAASEDAFAEMERIESLFTDWRDGSAVWRLNERAGESPVAVPDEVIDLVERALAVSRETGAAFDITYRTVGRFWSFAEGSQRIASDAEIAAALPHVGSDKIRVDHAAGTIFLTDRETQIGLGGIAKGYAVDRAIALLESRGVSDGILNAGGDLGVFRAPASTAAPARIAVRDPDRPERDLTVVSVCNGSVHTSGDYERFFERDGIRYHHILDPRTGRPARRARAVTVIVGADGTRGDGLSTGLFVLGAERSLAWAADRSDVAVLAVAPDGTVGTNHAWSAFEKDSLRCGSSSDRLARP